MNDPVNHPEHYTSHPSGVECIQVTEHMNFCLGNAVKYIWRAGSKGDTIQDLEKARWYLDREIARLKTSQVGSYAAVATPHEKCVECGTVGLVGHREPRGAVCADCVSKWAESNC